jgi:hypothetical protein
VSDFDDWNWLSDSLDRVQTVQLGSRVALLPMKLDWTVLATWAYALGEVDNRNETTPQPHPPEFPSTTNATARTQPAFEDLYFRVETGVRYWLTKQWALGASYAYEMFRKSDWRTDHLNPFVPGANSIYLGNDARNYTAQIVTVTLRYVFK